MTSIEIKSRYGNRRVLYVAETAIDVRDAVRQAVVGGADLRGPDLRGPDLRDADLRGADLRDANLRGAHLSGAADHSSHPLYPTRVDLWTVLDAAPAEVAGLRTALIDGAVDGSVYQGECACLVGTLANVKGCGYSELPGITPNEHRPAEAWFMPIREGDKPVELAEREGQFRAAVAVRWIDEWQSRREGTAP